MESRLFIDGPAGRLEAIHYQHDEPSALSASFVPASSFKRVAIICHPHPLKEGTMHNKVVHTLARAFALKGMDTVRFNYRGVGKSEGSFGDSIGEVADLMAVITWVNLKYPSAQITLAGFSFGAYIAARGATQHACHQLFSVAPAVSIQPYEQLPPVPCPWVVIQGENDEVVAPEAVYAWFEQAQEKAIAPMKLIKFPDTTHFFHSKLILLRETIENLIL